MTENINIERGILSAIIFDNTIFDDIKHKLKKSDFALPLHQDLWGVLTALANEDKPLTEDFIAGKIGENELIDIISANPIVSHEKYISELKDLSMKRNTRYAGAVAHRMSEDGKSLHEIINYLDDVAESNTDTTRHKTIAELLAMDFPKLERSSTLVEGFDKCCGGIFFPYFYLVNGERGAGKTTACLQIASGVSYKTPTLFISLEMNAVLVQRMFGRVKTPREMLIDFDNYDITDIEASIRTAHKKGVRLVLIDSLMKIRHRELKSASRTEQLGDISARLSRLKNKLNISIILIVQASKENNKSNGILETKGAGDVDYEADILIQIRKDGDDNEREFRCTKNRATGDEHSCHTKMSKDGIFPSPAGAYNASNGDYTSTKGVLE